MLGLDKLGARRNGPGKLMVFAGHANLGDQLVILKTDLRDFDTRHRSDDVDVTPADDRHHVRESVLFIDTPRRDLRIAGRIHAEAMLDVEFLTSNHAPSRNKPFVAFQLGSLILYLSVTELGCASSMEK